MNKRKNPPSKLVYNSSSQKNEGQKNREIGIEIIGEVPWGTHLCQFYKTKDDLIDILVPYFTKGLENNEFCMWITSEPLLVEDAKKALKKAVKNLEDYMKKGQIEILDASQWYTKSGKFDADVVLSGWVEKEAWARKKGFDGLRLTGNTFWLEKKDWKDFTNYEEIINHVIGNYKMIAICSYSLDKCNATEIIDVVSNHQFALIKREGKWHRIESPEMKKVEDALKIQRQLFETVVNSMPAAVNLIRGSDLKLQLINPAYQAIAPGKDMLGKTLDELWPETGQNFTQLCRKVLATGESYHVNDELNMIHRRPDSPAEPAYFSWSLYRVRLPGDDGWGILNIAWETTERKKAEEELLHHLQILDQIQDAIVISDPDFRITYWNKGAEQMYGYSQAEAVGKTTIELFQPIYAPGEREKIIDELNRLGTSKALIHTKHRNGTDIFVDVHSTRLMNKASSISGYVVTYRDVTERERAEEQLRETRDYLENLLNYANAPIIVWDKNFKITRFNHAFEHLTGYTSEMMIGKKLNILFPQESKKESLQKIQKTLSGEYWKSVEIPILHKDKDIRIALWNSANIYDNTGKNLIATIAQGTDITERKKVEESLKKNETDLKHAQEIAHLGNWELDINNNHLSWSDEVYRIFGLQPQEFTATYEVFLDAVHPDDRLAVDAAYSSSLRDGRNTYDIEHRIIRKNGEIRFVHEKCEHIRNKTGKVIRSIGMIHDITDFKKAEAELQESEEKYRRIVENTTNVIMVTQPDGIISYLSPSCKEVMGHSPDELIGTNPMIFHPDDTKMVQQALYRALQGEKGSDFEYRILTKAGDIKWISHSWSPIITDNKLQSIISVIADITERKTTENKIKKLNDNLMRRTIELAFANKELETFSYSVSHDLRAPLRSIDGFSQALLEDYGDILDENGKEYLNRVRKATERMSQLIDDMLRLSRLTRIEMNIQKVDLSSIAKTVIGDLKKTDPKRKITFITNEKLISEGDPNLLQILFENLLGNAWKFTKKRKQTEIEFGKTKHGQETVYYIRDNGAGFNMKYVDKLFIPFQRLHDDADYPGTGIGLGIVSRIINRHGGRIWADAEENKGATFYFTLGGKTYE